jgi:hypothetical protein
MRAEREEPEPRERVVPPTLAEIDQRIGERIAAEHQFMCDIIAEVVAHLQDEWEKGAMGPPGPSGPRGEQGPPGKLPLVKLWMPETVYYAGDVVAYDGGTFQAKRDTGCRVLPCKNTVAVGSAVVEMSVCIDDCCPADERGSCH